MYSFKKRFKNFKEAADAFALSNSLAQSDLGLFLGEDVESLEDMKKRMEEVYNGESKYDIIKYPCIDEDGFLYETYSKINIASLNAIRENGEIIGYEATYSVNSGKPLEYSSAWNTFKKEGWEVSEPKKSIKYEEFKMQKEYEDELIENIKSDGEIPGVDFYVSYKKEKDFDYVISHYITNNLDIIKTLLKNRPEIYDEVVEVAKNKLKEISKIDVPTNYDFNESLYKNSNFYVDAKQKVIESLEQIINKELVLEEPNPEYQEFLKLDIDETNKEEYNPIEDPEFIQKVKDVCSSSNNFEVVERKLYELLGYTFSCELMVEIADKCNDYNVAKTFEKIFEDILDRNGKYVYGSSCYTDHRHIWNIKRIIEEIERKEKTKELFFVCPSNSLETQTIIKLLQENGFDVAITNQISEDGLWSASWEKIEDEIKEKIEQAKADGKEVIGVNLAGNLEGTTNIRDIYNCSEFNEVYTYPAITGVGKKIGISQFDNETSLIEDWVASYDRFEENAKDLGLTPEEIEELWENMARRHRAASGVTLEEELVAQEAIENLGDLSECRDLITIDLPHSKIDTITCRLSDDEYENLLVTCTNGVTYYITFTSPEIINLLNKKFGIKNENGEITNCICTRDSDYVTTWRYIGTSEEQNKIKQFVTSEIKKQEIEQKDLDGQEY